MSTPTSPPNNPDPEFVDRIADQFEAAWSRLPAPRIEEYLGDAVDPLRGAILRELIALDVFYRRQHGEAPTPDEYYRRFPELKHKWLVRLIQTASPPLGEASASVNNLVDPLASVASDPAPSPQDGAARIQRIRCPHCHNPIQLVDEQPEEVLCPGCGSSFRVQDTPLTTTAEQMRQIGKFQLLERVGVGAFGAVWKAHDTELDRIVALKLPHASLLGSPADRERFFREARAAAQLRHPGIVTVHEVTELEGLPAIVADFVEGVTLRDLLRVRQLTFRESAELIAQVAESLDYAHSMRLVHRDIKPANIMIEFPPGMSLNSSLDSSVRTTPNSSSDPQPLTLDPQPSTLRPRSLLLDFGLALRDEAEVTMTVDGQIIGTPAYMSPEQAAGKSHDVDRRTDVYGLGVVLYELLVGELPFRGSKVMLVQQVLRDEPRSPRRVNDKIPRDLETICLKAMAKTPGRRYASARELADDLRRWQSGEPIRARRIGVTERTWRWCRRNPVVASLTGSVALLLVAVAVGGVAIAIRMADVAWRERRAAQTETAARIREHDSRLAAEKARKDAEAQRELAEAAERKGRLDLYASEINVAFQAYKEARLDRVLELLDGQRPTLGREDLRGFEWYYLWQRCHTEKLALFGHRNGHVRVAFSPVGTTLATVGVDSAVKLWEPTNGKLLGTLVGHTGPLVAVAFSPDGKMLATGGEARDKSGEVKLWDVETKQEGRTIRTRSTVLSIAFAPDGATLITAGGVVKNSSDQADPGELRIWDVGTGVERVVVPPQPSIISSVAISADGKQILEATGDTMFGGWPFGGVKVCDAITGQVKTRFQGHTHGNVYTVAISPDGTLAATGGFESDVRLWDLRTNQEKGILQGHTWHVWSVAFSPSGKLLAAASRDSSARLWDVASGRLVATFLGHSSTVTSVAFSADGRFLATGGADSTVRIWDIDSIASSSEFIAPEWDPGLTLRITDEAGQEVTTLRGTERVGLLAFSPDGRTLVSECRDGEFRLWDLQARTSRLGSRSTYLWSYSPDERWAACAIHKDRRRVQLLDYVSKTEHTLQGHNGDLRELVIAPDSSMLAVGTAEPGEIKLWDLATREARTLTQELGRVDRIVVDPRGERIVASGVKDNLGWSKVWDVASGKESSAQLGKLGGGRVAPVIAYSPDGKQLAIVRDPPKVTLYDGKTLSELASWTPSATRINNLVFSKDGRTLITTGIDGATTLWHVATQRELASLNVHTRPVEALALSADGRTVATGSRDTTIRLLRAADAQERVVLKGHTATIRSLAVSSDGQQLATASYDGSVKLWDIHSGKELATCRGHTDLLTCVAFSPNAKTIASGANDSTIRLWDAETGREQKTITFEQHVHAVAFSPDGSTLAVGSGDPLNGMGEVAILDTASNRKLGSVSTREFCPLSVTFSADGKTLAAAGRGRSDLGGIILVDVARGQEARTTSERSFGGLRFHSVAFSADGKTIATGGWDNSIRFWNATTGEEEGVLHGHTGPIFCVAFSSDGRTLASASADRTIKLWDWQAKKALVTLQGHSIDVQTVAFTPDGKTLISGGGDRFNDKAKGELKLWDLPRKETKPAADESDRAFRDRAVRRELKPLPIRIESPEQSGMPGEPLSSMALVTRPAQVQGLRSWTIETRKHRGWVFAVSNSPNGRWVASGGLDGTVRIWDAEDGELRAALVGHNGAIWDITWSADARYLASGSSDGTVAIWSAESGALLNRLTGHRERVTSVSWSSDGKRLAAGCVGTDVLVWDVETGAVLQTLRGHQRAELRVAWSPDGKTLATASLEPIVRLWDGQSGEVVRAFPVQTKGLPAIAWSADGRTIAVGSEGPTVALFDSATGDVRRVCKAEGESSISLAWSPDGKRIASVGVYGVRTWSAESGELVQSHPRPQWLYDISWSPIDNTIAVAGRAGIERLWAGAQINDWASGLMSHEHRRTHSLSGRIIVSGSRAQAGTTWLWSPDNNLPAQRVEQVGVSVFAWSPDERRAAMAMSDKTIRILDADTRRALHQLEGHSAPIDAVAWSVDSKLLATGSQDGAVRTWDADSGKLLNSIKAHRYNVATIAWSPDGKSLASAALEGDQGLKLWNAATGELVRALVGHEGDVDGVAWSPNGKMLASCGHDYTVRLWNPATGEPIVTLRGHTDEVNVVAWSPDSTLIASGSNDGSIRIWDALMGRLIQNYPMHTGGVDNLCLKDDGKTLVTSDNFGTIRYVELLSGQMKATLLDLAESMTIAFSADGHYRSTSPADAELVYIAVTDSGQKLLAPAEFAATHGWKNERMKVHVSAESTTSDSAGQ